MHKRLSEYIAKLKLGENPVLSILDTASIGKTNFLVSFFEQVLNCQVIVIKDLGGLRHISFFKAKWYTIIFDTLAWLNENINYERMLQILSGEVITNTNIKRSSVLVPKDICRVLRKPRRLFRRQFLCFGGQDKMKILF